MKRSRLWQTLLGTSLLACGASNANDPWIGPGAVDGGHDASTAPGPVDNPTTDTVDGGPETCVASNPVGPPGSYVPGAYAVRCGSRDAFRWPYSKNSPWNMPIGSAANYVASGITATVSRFGDHNDGDLIFGVDPNVNVRTTAADPLATVYRGDYHTCSTDGQATNFFGGPTPFQFHVPIAFVTRPYDTYGANDANLSSAFVQPDETIIQLNYTGRCTSGGPIIGTPVWEFMVGNRSTREINEDQRLRDGMGIYGGHGGSAMSAHGGNLRKGDLTSDEPIKHALSMDLWGLFLHYEETCQDPHGSCRGYRWPAATNDGAAHQGASNIVGGYYGGVPDVRMGALLALLPSLTEAELGLQTLEGKKLFHALQDYGAYIVDDTGWRRTDFNMDVEAIQDYERIRGYGFGSANGSFGAERPEQLTLFKDLQALVVRLQVVSNNSATSIGGGGTPRQPLAPDFSP